jgi:hypothetical protein
MTSTSAPEQLHWSKLPINDKEGIQEDGDLLSPRDMVRLESCVLALTLLRSRAFKATQASTDQIPTHLCPHSVHRQACSRRQSQQPVVSLLLPDASFECQSGADLKIAKDIKLSGFTCQ